MKILVPIKRVIDPYVKVRVRDDGTGVETKQVKMAINPFCEIAIEQAVQLKEQGIATEIILVSIGNSTVQESLRNGLALGADRAICVQVEDNNKTLCPLTIAKILAQISNQEQVDLIIMGKQAIDGDHNQTGQMLAGLLDWPQATFASKIEFSDDKKLITVAREIDAGIETVLCELPAVVTTDLRLNEPRFASLPNIMKAKSKPLAIVELSQFKLDLNEDIHILSVSKPAARSAGVKVNSVSELVEKLRNEAKVIE